MHGGDEGGVWKNLKGGRRECWLGGICNPGSIFLEYEKYTIIYKS